MIHAILQTWRKQPELRTLVWLGGGLVGGYMLFVVPYLEDFSISGAECKKLNQLWQVKYSKEFSFSQRFPESLDDCTSSASALIRGLDFLSTTEFQVPENQPQLDYYQWVKNLKPVFDYRPMLNLAGKATFSDRRVEINSALLDQGNPLTIASVIVHELRHLEEGRNTHVRCKIPENGFCDAELPENPLEGGAYSYNLLFLYQVRQYSNVNAAERRSAERLMRETLEKRFNLVPENAMTKYRLDKPN